MGLSRGGLARSEPARADSNGDQKQVSLYLDALNAAQVQAIDRALKEIGEYGEVHLIVNRGHLRFIGKFKTESVESE